MTDERVFARRVLMLVSAGFGALLLSGLAAGLVMMRTQTQTRWVNHSYDVERHVSSIRLSLEQLRSARRGQLIGLALPPEARFDAAEARLMREIDAVARLTADNPKQRADAERMKALATRMDALMRHALRPGAVRLEAEEAERQRASRAVEALADTMMTEERRLLAERDAERRFSVEMLYAVLSLTVVLLAIVGTGSILVIRRYTRSLLASRDALSALNENLEDAVAVRTTDLQRANDEIQRFAYIVSHDLRSPLVNVMGFTAELDAAIKPLHALIERADAEAPELVSPAARLAVDEDLPEAVGFIRTSTQKMDRLINAILRLSREGRRTITAEPLPLAEVAQGVVDALRHRIDELGVTVTVAPDLPVIVSDRLAVEQILSNLVENAVKYRAPDRPGLIQITGHRSHGRAIVAVADNGRGIEKRDHDRIFDLFRRSGTQDQQGEGIGLAHVRALAYRLGGTIGVESELGRGSTFTVNLPVNFAGDKGGRQ